MTGRPNGSYNAAGGSQRDSHGDAPAADGKKPGGSFPPMAEIVASAQETVNDLRKHTIGRLLEEARLKLRSALFRLDTRHSLAAAYWEYLVAFQIVVEAIPRHQTYYDKVHLSRGQMHRDYQDLVKDVRTHESRFQNIKQIILNDNMRNGAKHSSRPSSAASMYIDGANLNPSQPRPSNRRDDELMLPEGPPAAPTGANGPKPQVHPKPQSLHGRGLHQNSGSADYGPNSGDDLAERFAKLRGLTPKNTAPADLADATVKMPSASDHYFPKPMGPRGMPPKLPLNTDLGVSMPREPSPTYSPARNLSLPESIQPPRSSARSIVGSGGRNNSLQASGTAPQLSQPNGDSGSYLPHSNDNSGSAPPARKASVNRQTEDQIPVEKFYDYIRMYNILVIDVRPREEFDSGHIYVGSIICVEPPALHDGCSAEQLAERLVLSPDEEQAMFDRRDQYDLVVYYDAGTKTSAFLHKHDRSQQEIALKRLHDALDDFNNEKPLKRPPIFLMGGIAAWTDMLGSQGLKVSSTATIVASKRRKPARSITRVTADSHAGKVDFQKRRDYTLMDPEEERRWLAEVREGRAVFAEPEEIEDDLDGSLYHSTEDFLRRFPSVETERQSMIHPPRRPPPPPQHTPPPIPVAPSRPAPSVSRVSYSGVHERQNTPQARPSDLQLYVSPSRHGQIRLHRTGLLNFGVTCYMNSVVQCLSGNSDLAHIFLTRRYEKYLQRENWKGTKGILSESFATLLSNLFKGDVGALRPSTFRRVCGHFNAQWAVDEQQDAKEFLEFVLDYLHEDLNMTWNKAPLKPLTEAEEMKREALPRPYVAMIEWSRYVYRENSLIGQLFAGQHASRLTCMACGTTSTTYEAFWSISVEIPHDRPADLRDCLRSYCAHEQLTGKEEWRCPRCKTNREAMKKITITRAPESLVIHFKRFKASHTERAHKVRTAINFPLRGLDLGPFMEPPMTPAEEAVVVSNARDGANQLAALKSEPAMNGPYQYNAYAVIWHIGNTLGSGHYVAHVKDKASGCWRQFNDDRITDFDPGALPPHNRLQNEKAYIVFYEREKVAGGAL
ncbi:ubiquitin carboxyl-terminal hydrolase 2 [Westerdykella ornata]|uniref:Ubiquitin carboxyl-terminal hydrolase 2 n=1 Tax=Westerdykella ornata TaxID=318751 RepID=A0A6A6JHE6_WESOR|nr:ubiquitin carboxyl-terminal hydrolase 2 [Westerdykella ornata]KAF2275388.1 ubiquitin carboxyl-terminal hydrolase 2 [Westerdykella ornata]